jgi:hypothetical protein
MHTILITTSRSLSGGCVAAFTGYCSPASFVNNFMPNETEEEPKMMGLDMLLDMGATDRAQAIWDRAMNPEAQEFMIKLARFNAGRGPDPGDYTGPEVDFEKAAQELEEEEPESRNE